MQCPRCPAIFSLIKGLDRSMRRGVKPTDENGGDWKINELLYAGDTVLLEETREHLQHFVNKFERACDSMELKINVGKSQK